MTALGVNIDHVATLREVRKVAYPDPIVAAQLAQDAGADQITCHLREDRRHIRDEDIPRLQKILEIPLNLEMAATEEMKRFALLHRPAKITLVPEKRQELTTEGGLDIVGSYKNLKYFLNDFTNSKIQISLFIDPDPRQIEASLELSVQAVEFHTGSYCEATEPEKSKVELERLRHACAIAHQKKLFVAVGHGLNYQNILPVTKIPHIQEYNIGHSIVAHAVIVGFERAVREMKSLIA